MRRGGDAGGTANKFGLEGQRVVPKFLENLKVQLVKKEASLADKFDDKFKNDFVNREDDYDLENAQVVNPYEDDDNPDELPQIQPDHRKLSSTSDQKDKKGDQSKNKEASKANEKVDITSFHPTFKSKKKETENEVSKPTKEQENKVEVASKPKETKAADIDKTKPEGKRGLDAYVIQYIKEDEKKKKVKSNLLSFNDE